MNFKINFAIVLLLLIGCKKEIKPKNATEQSKQQETTTPKENIGSMQDSITVFHVLFITTDATKTPEKIHEITSNLQPEFIDFPFTNDSNQLKETKQIYQDKSFLKALSEDFMNTDFLDVATIDYSCVLPQNNKGVNYIAIEEWNFKSQQKAKSAFESLKNYKETEIHFKTINWIWVYQANKIFLIFATDFMVTDPEMQTIKQEIIKTIASSGDYETIQFYE